MTTLGNNALPDTTPATEANDFHVIERAYHSVLRGYGLLRQVMDPYFARFGISSSQWAVLRVLQRAEAAGECGLRASVLSERLLIQPPSVSAVLDRLERYGLLKRHGFKKDQRVRLISLTPKGRNLVASVLRGHADQIRSLFAAHEPAEVRQFLQLHEKFEKRLRVLAELENET